MEAEVRQRPKSERCLVSSPCGATCGGSAVPGTAWSPEVSLLIHGSFPRGLWWFNLQLMGVHSVASGP